VRTKANSRPGSATVTTGRFRQVFPAALTFTASNRAPTAGPPTPSSHVQLDTSGLNSGVRVTSATSA
jgi:hypothetical protein